METISALFSQYGLFAVFLSVFIEQLGAPVPAVPILLLAGMTSANNSIFAVEALSIAAFASMLADLLWFYAGRRFGRRVLALICRISISPDGCVRQSELSFARRGEATLVIAKFIPGLSTLASPLAGAIGMSAASFMIFNLAGALLWAGSAIIGGLLFHEQVGELIEVMSNLGSFAIVIGTCLLGIYIAARAWRRWRASREVANLPRVQPHELADLIARGEDLMIVDVRATLTKEPFEERIPGARRIELANLEMTSSWEWSSKSKIITYCACPNDASALKAAFLLTKQGMIASVLQGGIEGWTEAGYTLEAGEF
jgi:membrane protein DedA with SNARE-associated domain/rhodanese-related sulfurtransferase